jgi:hypothetical protein
MLASYDTGVLPYFHHRHHYRCQRLGREKAERTIIYTDKSQYRENQRGGIRTSHLKDFCESTAKVPPPSHSLTASDDGDGGDGRPPASSLEQAHPLPTSCTVPRCHRIRGGRGVRLSGVGLHMPHPFPHPFPHLLQRSSRPSSILFPPLPLPPAACTRWCIQFHLAPPASAAPAEMGPTVTACTWRLGKCIRTGQDVKESCK